jgi:RimJ/RimL family protein N-acetyltransferase
MISFSGVEKFGIKLRPVTFEDAEFIVNLRCQPDISRYIGDTSPDINAQKKWLKEYFTKDNDYYFCIELSSGKKAGTIGVYNIENNIAEWGRWVISPAFPIAPASAWLIYYISFEILNLSEVYCRTVSENKQVVSFHDSCGIPRKGIEKNAVCINGKEKDLIIHSVKREQWETLKQKLYRPANLVERLLNEVR